MSIFLKYFIQKGNTSFTGLRKTAKDLLPKDKAKCDALYEELHRGKQIIEDEDHLNMYLYSYGKMHKAKLDTAFNTFVALNSICSQGVEIYDWGCGQGTATICLLDYLNEYGTAYKIKRINLIEPSEAALERAEEILSVYDSDIVIRSINKTFNDLAENDFNVTGYNKLHLFSNILDVENFDLADFTHLFQKAFYGSNYFICVGPYYFNNKRIDEFIAAIAPETVFARFDKERGSWMNNDWTISLRIFCKDIQRIENVGDIRRRIDDFHKKDQLFAGYILDSVSEDFSCSCYKREIDTLLESLCMFDVRSNKSLKPLKSPDSKISVLANIVSRGLPTKAPLKLEDYFAEFFNVSDISTESADIIYKSRHLIDSRTIFETLHVVDPRFKIDFYNGDMLESSFEKHFLANYLKGSDSEYLIQILEPQRPLSSLVNIPDERFSKDQRVDFALEVPYGITNSGFIFEIDGIPYHSNVFQRLNDERRDAATAHSGWDTYRLAQLNDRSFIKNWESVQSTNTYLNTIKDNYRRKLEGIWKDDLQIVLTPLAVARLERTLLQAVLSGALDLHKKEWNIAVIERDVPCAAIAMELINESYEKISELAGSCESLPLMHLYIISTEEFKNSPLHLGKDIYTSIPNKNFDVCFDISMLLRDNIDALPLNIKSENVYVIRTSHYKKHDRTICSAENIAYPDFVEKDATGKYKSIGDREDVLVYFLNNIFRKRSFRPGQLPILSHILSDRTTIGLLPTGGGKSLTYQLSCMLQPGVTIVVDPLVSLMADQIRGLRKIRIDVCDSINGCVDGRIKQKKLNAMQNGSVIFMLLSPERFMIPQFRESVIATAEKNHVYFSYGVIDEVHCVSEWGHDFRTAYLHLGRNMINFMHTKSGRPISLIGLTATASFDVLADVERELTLGGNLAIDSDTIVRSEDDKRPELVYRIIEINTSFDEFRDKCSPLVLNVKDEFDLRKIVAENKRRFIIDLLHNIPYDLEAVNERKDKCSIKDYVPEAFYKCGDDGKYINAGLLFCPHAHGMLGVENSNKENHNSVTDFIRTNQQDGLKIGTYVGGDDPEGDMRTFNDDDENFMIATKAFGMGIDKSNIRYVIHMSPCSSIEGYVQEAGRGGRDKKYTISYVLFDTTEYICLTIDKINKILNLSDYGSMSWLMSYINRFVLIDDFYELCRQNNCSENLLTNISNILRKSNYIESVDKNINLWFHNNSFRGMFKEKVILNEMTDRILNVKPCFLLKIQNKLREEVDNEDILLKIDKRNNALKILSVSDLSKQYGYVFLKSLKSSFNYVTEDLNLCSHICRTLISILLKCPEYTLDFLMKPVSVNSEFSEGIYNVMDKADVDGYVYVTVTWENGIKQDSETFEESIKTEITNISRQCNWQDIDEQHYGRLNLDNIDHFRDLLNKICRCSNDNRWGLHNEDERVFSKLRILFSSKRDKDDTDKAIYRMCCIGLVEDVSVDYSSETYELKIKNRSDEEFRENMLNFFRKYYSLQEAERRVKEIDEHKGRRYLDKCLGYLTEFVYQNLKKKRLRAIDDMRYACIDSISDRKKTNNDDWLKEFIHLYFNSKYARNDYMVNDKPYSLSKDTTGELQRSDFELVIKYIGVIKIDSSGDEIENVKHLYGATLLCLRADTENPALHLLLTFCIAFLGVANNNALKQNAYDSYIEAFVTMYNNIGHDMWECMDRFNEILVKLAKEDLFSDKMLVNARETITFLIHEDKFNNIVKKYTKQ